MGQFAAHVAQRIAKARGIDQTTIDRAIESRRYAMKVFIDSGNSPILQAALWYGANYLVSNDGT